MIYIYSCYAGTHSSSIASAIHLEQISGERVPEKNEILSINCFDKLDTKDMGKIVYRGTDSKGNRVYTLGRGSSGTTLPSMINLLRILQNDWGLKEKVIISNMSPMVPIAMSIGGFISRRLKMGFIGTPFLIFGTKQVFMKIAKCVNNTKERAKNAQDMIVFLNNNKQEF